MNSIIENPLKRLEELVADIPRRETDLFNSPNCTYQHCIGPWWTNNEYMAWHSWFNLHNIEATKQFFYTCGKLDVLRVSRFNVPLFGYGRTHISYVALSDNKTVIDEFAQLNYKLEYEERGKKVVTNFKERAAKGMDDIYCDTMIRAMAMDYEGLEKNIMIYEQKVSQLKKNKWMEPDFDFFRGILKKDKDKVFKAIEELTKPRIHNTRNAHDILYIHLVSQPAIGFAKSAWINGLEIEPTSKLIPKDLLPIKPNSSYRDDYLKYDQ